MKLNHISVKNVAGVAAAEIETRAPVVIVAGANGHGKSSVLNAVRMALTSDTSARGITLKKDLGGLVHDGAKTGEVLLRCASGPELYALVPAGKCTLRSDYVPHAAMPFVTSPERFAALSSSERRAALFEVTGLSADAATIRARLLCKGLAEKKVDQIAPLLRAGLDAASKEAKAQATQSKGAWRAVTGEVYGSVKASEWKAPMGTSHADGEPTDPAKLRACEAALESWQREAGKLQAEQQRRAEMAGKLPALDEHAARIARIERKLSTDKEELAAQTARLDAMAAAATGTRVGLVHDLAQSLDELLDAHKACGDWPSHKTACSVLATYEREHGPVGTGAGDPAAAAALPALRQSVEMLARAIANDNRDLAAAQRAEADAEAIRAELAQPAGTGLADACDQVETLKAERAALARVIDAAAAAKRIAEEARAKTTQAARHHADVAEWDAIGDALAPDGIQAEMLGEALDPINDRLAKSAMDAEWPRVGIESDMSISVGDGARPYALCSESERWRADAMLAEAISHLSGLKLLVLDRFDVLDLPGRSDLIAWMDILAQDGEIDTALLCGTLKALPTGLPDTVAAHWIENGRIDQTIGEAAATSDESMPSAPVCDLVQIGESGKPKKPSANAAKYRDPATGQTWTGRGLKPRWLVEALHDGRTLDEFLINPAPATAAA